MNNRVPTPGQEGRVKVTTDSGEVYYATIEMADNPTQPGTPWAKETALTDETEDLIFGNHLDRTVDDAFRGLMSRISLIMANTAAITLNVRSANGNPLRGVYVDGVFDINGLPLKSDSSGVINGYVSEGNVVLKVSGYSDIEDFSTQFQAVKGESYTKTINLTTRNFLSLTSSGNVKFSENVQTLDVSAVGAGGGAGGTEDGGSGAYDYAVSGPGGGGGFVNNQYSVFFEPNMVYKAVVGVGGVGREEAAGKDGGYSELLGVRAEGGKGGALSDGSTAGEGGTGNGNGAPGAKSRKGSYRNGYDGNPGTGEYFTSFYASSPVSGGGASGASGYKHDNGVHDEAPKGGTGGTPNGGNGGNLTRNGGTSSAKDGAFPGGGGGGPSANVDYRTVSGHGTFYSLSIGAPGNGADGVIAMRMHLRVA